MQTVKLFRVIFALALIFISYMAFTTVEYKVVETTGDKINHLLAFLLLAGLCDFSFPKSGFTLTKFFFLVGYGFFIESVQYYIPTRTFSLLDIVADTFGIVIYIFIITFFSGLSQIKKRWTNL